MSDLGRRFPDDYTIAELHAIATRALANGDDHARANLREQLEQMWKAHAPNVPTAALVLSAP